MALQNKAATTAAEVMVHGPCEKKLLVRELLCDASAQRENLPAQTRAPVGT